LAAREYERVAAESGDDKEKRNSLLAAAQLHEDGGDSLRAIDVYRRYVDSYPEPIDINIETRSKLAAFLKENDSPESYLAELQQIVSVDALAGKKRTPRMRYLAAQAALVLAEKRYEDFVRIELVVPFEVNLNKKQHLMKAATKAFSHLIEYEVAETTAAATFYLAEIHAHFSLALTASERPEGLNALEKEQYELAIEEQAYPFEEQAIEVHESNIQLIARGVYNVWVEKGLRKLAGYMPARHDKAEEKSDIIGSLDIYEYLVDRPVAAQAAGNALAVSVHDEPG